MIKRKTQLWTWKVTPLDKKDTEELWEGQRQDVKKPREEAWICKEKRKGVWECKMIREGRRVMK